MVKTTLYLTEQQKAGLEAAAAHTGRTEADLVRAALDRYLVDVAPTRPDFPLLPRRGGPGTSHDAARVDELLAEHGFGRC
ncbi:MAG: ribbon-helix-helix protein, CopG family [Sporichthyaceae bacterium]